MSAPIEAAGIGYAVDGKALVADVALRVESGGFTVIIGPNGAGKSTLVRLLTGELRASSGAALCLGEPVGRIPGWRLACLRAVLPQASRLAFPFTVREIARIGQDGVGRGLSARDRAALVGRALARADVGHLADRRIRPSPEASSSGRNSPASSRNSPRVAPLRTGRRSSWTSPLPARPQAPARASRSRDLARRRRRGRARRAA